MQEPLEISETPGEDTSSRGFYGAYKLLGEIKAKHPDQDDFRREVEPLVSFILSLALNGSMSDVDKDSIHRRVWEDIKTLLAGIDKDQWSSPEDSLLSYCYHMLKGDHTA